MTVPSSASGLIRIGIMGFGHIGRNLYRLAAEIPNLEIAVISDVGDPEILNYLLQRDSIYGSFSHDTEYKNGEICLDDGRKSAIVRAVAPGDINWSYFGVDVIVEATGRYSDNVSLDVHLSEGANRVILSTLPKDDIDRLVVMGVNEATIKTTDRKISAGSSTTNASAHLLKVLVENFDVDRAMLTSIHAYTSDQALQDTARSDFRRSRSAAENIIPNDTDTPRWIERLIPELDGKIEGIALNVPVASGSCVDLTTRFGEDGITVAAVNDAFRTAASKNADIIGITDDPIVSSDVIGSRHSLIFDTQATMQTTGRLLKTLAWYDNSMGHAARILELIQAYDALNGSGGAS